LVVVREAIDVIFRHLESLPPSDRRELLRTWLHECLQESEQWSASPTTQREREALMKRLLALHVAVTTLERQALLDDGEVDAKGSPPDGDEEAPNCH
jgi:hypothetical protein